MPALAPYIPPKDADLAIWAANFSSLITASPATYGLTAGDATAIAAANTTWQSALTTATSPSTRTPASVSAKNTAKIDFLAIARPYAVTVSLNAGVSSANKIALGVNPRTSVPSPITAPTTNPVLTLDVAYALSHVLRYRDATASPSVKAKPYGVIGVQIFAAVARPVGTTPPVPITNPDDLALVATASKSPTQVGWSSGDVGLQAYYAARWITRTGLFGPWSPIVNFTVAGS